MKDKILITGAGGFIGSALSKALKSKCYDIIEFSHTNFDVTNSKNFIDIPDVSYVFHLASLNYAPSSWIIPDEYIKVNVSGTVNVLEYCVRSKAKLLFMSSYVYGTPNSLPVSESEELKPFNPYALSKIFAEDVCKFYNKTYGLKINIFRPFNIFGLNQKKDFLIPTIISQVKSGGPIILKDLSPKRDFLYLDDLISALIKAIHIHEDFSTINLGYGVSYTVLEIVQIIQKLVNTDFEVISENSSRMNEINDVYANIEKAKILLNWKPKVSLEEGLRRILINENLI